MQIEWTERYSCYTARIGRVGEVSVAWVGNGGIRGFQVTVFGMRLKELSADADAGKARAVAMARRLMTEALAATAADPVVSVHMAPRPKHSGRQFGIKDVAVAEMEQLLANAAVTRFSDSYAPPSKREFSFQVAMDGVKGPVCAVWDHKGSDALGIWSAFGDRASLVAVFGASRVEG